MATLATKLTGYDVNCNICGWAKYSPQKDQWIVRVRYGTKDAHCLMAKFIGEAEALLMRHGAREVIQE